jgi:hypothetical protein
MCPIYIVLETPPLNPPNNHLNGGKGRKESQTRATSSKSKK